MIDYITKNYKIGNDNLIDTINSDSKKIIFEIKKKRKYQNALNQMRFNHKRSQTQIPV